MLELKLVHLGDKWFIFHKASRRYFHWYYSVEWLARPVMEDLERRENFTRQFVDSIEACTLYKVQPVAN